MIDEQTLHQAVARIVSIAAPCRVILFGSHGRGDFDENSDVDLMIIEPRLENRGEEILRLYEAVGHIGVSVDLLVYSDAEYERRSQVPGTVLYWARKEGKVLYESAH